jgi:hypothetical protein
MNFLNSRLLPLTNLLLFYPPQVLVQAALEACLFCAQQGSRDAWWAHPALQVPDQDPADTYRDARLCICEFNRLKKVK